MNAATITRQSKSNLALAFVSLGRERKRDITIFYAFCRVVDDIADSAELSVIEKRVRLANWRQMLRASTPDEPLLARDVRQLMHKYSLPPEMLEEIIAGVEMDLSILRYSTFEELRVYCYRVASAVGLVSIEIFGYRNPRLPRIRDRSWARLANDKHHSRRLRRIFRQGAFICRRKIWRGSTIRKRSWRNNSTTSTSSS